MRYIGGKVVLPHKISLKKDNEVSYQVFGIIAYFKSKSLGNCMFKNIFVFQIRECDSMTTIISNNKYVVSDINKSCKYFSTYH